MVKRITIELDMKSSDLEAAVQMMQSEHEIDAEVGKGRVVVVFDEGASLQEACEAVEQVFDTLESISDAAEEDA